jgi:hypothetical protein
VGFAIGREPENLPDAVACHAVFCAEFRRTLPTPCLP